MSEREYFSRQHALRPLFVSPLSDGTLAFGRADKMLGTAESWEVLGPAIQAALVEEIARYEDLCRRQRAARQPKPKIRLTFTLPSELKNGT